jgi:16S rRNA (guanine1207-N2)-methyltransferase
VLLIGAQACMTVDAANQLTDAGHVALLHLDRAAGGVGCGFGNPESYLSSEPAAARAGDVERYAVVGFNAEAPKSYRLLREIVAALPSYLQPDGVVLAAGPRKGGADVAATALREVFETVTLLTYRKGHRVYRASEPRPSTAAHTMPDGGDVTPVSVLRVLLRGLDIQLVHDDRIFARGRLDPATAMLAGCFEVPPGADLLDLGCGGGVLGILAALIDSTSRVTLTDADPLAVEVSRRNAALNGAANVTVFLSDVLVDLPGQTFDVVLMNPPFHQGRTQDVGIAHRFIAEAGAALRPGGRLYLVCNRFLRYESVIAQHVGPVTELAGDQRYKVVVAQRPS